MISEKEKIKLLFEEKNKFHFVTEENVLDENSIFNDNIIIINKPSSITLKNILQFMGYVGSAVLFMVDFWILFVFLWVMLGETL